MEEVLQYEQESYKLCVLGQVQVYGRRDGFAVFVDIFIRRASKVMFSDNNKTFTWFHGPCEREHNELVGADDNFDDELQTQ